VSLIKGPVSWYGEEGETYVESQGIRFTFRGGGGNGTSSIRGQFPALLIR